jgi:hypothetical protein
VRFNNTRIFVRLDPPGAVVLSAVKRGSDLSSLFLGDRVTSCDVELKLRRPAGRARPPHDHKYIVELLICCAVPR